MRNVAVKLTMLVFLIALLAGFYSRLPLMDNFIRAFVIYVGFSVLILLIFLVHNQSSYNALKTEMNKNHSSGNNKTSEQ